MQPQSGCVMVADSVAKRDRCSSGIITPLLAARVSKRRRCGSHMPAMLPPDGLGDMNRLRLWATGRGASSPIGYSQSQRLQIFFYIEIFYAVIKHAARSAINHAFSCDRPILLRDELALFLVLQNVVLPGDYL